MGIFDGLLNKLGAEAQNAINSASVKVKSGINDTLDDLVRDVKKRASIRKKEIRMEKLPQNAEEMKGMRFFDQKNEYAVAAFTVAALLRYAENKEDGKAMLDLLNGPEDPSNLDLQMMDERLDGQAYLMRSYFEGAKPENDYRPDEPYRIEVEEYKNSRDVENYLYLYIPSGGADTPRQIQLRKKPSTGEWFIWVFSGLLMDIRVPVSEDKWA